MKGIVSLFNSALEKATMNMSESDSEGSEGMGGRWEAGSSRYCDELGIQSCFSQERDKLYTRFPGAKVRKVKNYEGLDRNMFDLLGLSTFW